MNDVPSGPTPKSCGGCKLGLVNLVLNSVILLILLIHFLSHHHHFFCHKPGGFGERPMWGYHGPQPGPGPWGAGPGGPMHSGFGPGHEGWGDHHGPMDPQVTQDAVMDHLTHLLSLTDQQKTQLRPIVADAVTALQKNHEQSHEAAKQIIDTAKAKAMPFLTADQKKIVDSMPEHKP